MNIENSAAAATDRSALSIVLLILAACIVLAWGSSFAGPTVQIQQEYWRWIAPIAIPTGIFIAWRLHKALVGSWYKPRNASEERQMGTAESWTTGMIAAVILVALGGEAFANVMNQVVGVPYAAAYEVAGKFTERGKRTCYGLTTVRIGNPTDRFQMCVSRSEQEATGTRRVLQVRGRRSRFVNQILSYTEAQ
ncbi:hypothetical protein PQR29_20125 [Paraburkholderia strydomiana]|uniref:hypothetical protein n=1 Tax=Paraburkholderia strydomiana TaxID=1245417 RepID=UPI0038BA5077